MPTLTVIALFIFGGVALAAEKPNIVLSLGDDQAWGDYGFMGHPDIHTANLDNHAHFGVLAQTNESAAL